MFEDRVDAGKRLAEAVAQEEIAEAVVLALPRGGVPVAAEIARILQAPLDLVMVRKLGTPGQEEVAMGAVARCGEATDVVLNDEIISQMGITDAAIETVKERELQVLEEREQSYLAGRQRASVSGRTAIIVDDGIATGATTRAALRAVRHLHPERLIMAAPVAPPATVARLEQEADLVICLEQPSLFGAISPFYRNFPQLTDEEVIALLDEPGQKSESRQEHA